MNIDRMRETIALLRRVNAHEGEFAHATFNYRCVWRDYLSCGTVACAGGFMCLHAPFIQQGLSVSPYMDNPLYKDETGTRALALFLGIDEEKAEIAFVDLGEVLTIRRDKTVPPSDVTAHDVADYLQTLLEQEQCTSNV